MVIGEIQKNTTEKITVSAVENRGHELIDIRVYCDVTPGEWKPTKKGISVAPDKLAELVALLKNAEDS